LTRRNSQGPTTGGDSRGQRRGGRGASSSAMDERGSWDQKRGGVPEAK